MSNFPNRTETIKKVQRFIGGLLVDGDDGEKTWNAIIAKLNIPEETVAVPSGLSPKSFALILEYEVGGGESYYNKALKSPTWPGGASGVTIGIGYDLGYNNLDQFTKDWGSKLDQNTFSRLSKVLGVKGSSAKSLISSVKDISIPWDVAVDVFKTSTLPRFIQLTIQTFPNSNLLHPDAFGALVSIIFNRGSSLSGDSRREMAEIKELVADKQYNAIADQIRRMKRLWIGKGLDGLLRRREAEAVLVESCEM